MTRRRADMHTTTVHACMLVSMFVLSTGVVFTAVADAAQVCKEGTGGDEEDNSVTNLVAILSFVTRSATAFD